MFLERIQALIDRLSTYSWVEMGVEYAIIWLVVYLVVRFVQGTRAAGALKGLLVLIIVFALFSRVLGGAGAFQRLGLLYDRFLALFAIALIVIFQPELRRALVRLGETPFWRASPKDIRFIVDEVSEAASYLSKAKFGALIVFERQSKLGGQVEGGTTLNAQLSAAMLQTIFFPGSALHDLAVVVQGRTIQAAGVQLPLADPSEMPDARLGSRHRAAVGLSQECDALVLVVSEETGHIRLAERGTLSQPIAREDLAEELERRLLKAPPKRDGGKPLPAESPREMQSSAAGESVAGDSFAGQAYSGDPQPGDTMVTEAIRERPGTDANDETRAGGNGQSAA